MTNTSIRSPAEQAGFSPDRPWNRPDRQPWALGVHLGGKIAASESSIGWAAFQLRRKQVDGGELVFRPDQTEAQKIAEAVTQYRLLRQEWGDRPVRVYRFRKTSFHRSRAAVEGMSHEQHEAMARALGAALKAEGATVEFEVV